MCILVLDFVFWYDWVLVIMMLLKLEVGVFSMICGLLMVFVVC